MTPAELMARVQAEWDEWSAASASAPYGAMPPEPDDGAEPFAALGDAGLRYLAEMIATDRTERWRALEILEKLGPRARAAADDVARRVGAVPRAAAALYAIDPQRALAAGLHVQPSTALFILQAATPAAQIEITRQMIATRNPTLGGLALRSPHAPLDAVRSAVDIPEVQALALDVLLRARRPEDAPLLIAKRAQYQPWLAGFAGSEALQTRDMYEEYDRLRRRRCAGLDNRVIDLAPRILATAKTVPWYVEFFADVGREKRDPAILDHVTKLAPDHAPSDGFDPVVTAFSALGMRVGPPKVMARVATWTMPDWMALAADMPVAYPSFSGPNKNKLGYLALALYFDPAHAAARAAYDTLAAAEFK